MIKKSPCLVHTTLYSGDIFPLGLVTPSSLLCDIAAPELVFSFTRVKVRSGVRLHDRLYEKYDSDLFVASIQRYIAY